jgi:hypothetical protein
MNSNFTEAGGPAISLDKTKSVCCEKCDNTTFREAVLIRKASGMLIGSSKDAIIPIPVFECSKCNYVNEEFLPKEIKGLDKKGI